VQGAIASRPGNQLQVNAAVVDVGSAGIKGQAQGKDVLDRLFDIEKQVALGLFTSMGIQLSPAERAAINQRPTQNLQAFLMYSRGLVAQDNGDFSAAQADFDQAATLDPSFRAAVQGAATATSLSAASQQSVSQVESAVSQTSTIEGGTPPAPVGDALNSGTNSVAPTTTSNTATTTGTVTTPPPTDRGSPIPETTGTTGGQRATGQIIIIITRPPVIVIPRPM